MARGVLALVLVLALAACSTPRRPTFVPPRSPSASPSSSPETPTEITLAFGGDVHFVQRTATLLKDPSTAFGPVSEILSEADVAMVNLETAVTTRGTPEPKTFHFRAPPTAYGAVRAAGIDVVSLANNHALDYGRQGLEDTLTNAESTDTPVVGAGRNVDEAFKPWITTVRGTRIAFLGMSQIAELSSSWAAKPDRSGLAMAFDTTRAVKAVKAAKAEADVVVVFMHWGQEYKDCPNSAQKTLAKKLADAGATLIVGSHVHLLQGSGWLGRTFVAYGLSNFLWWYNDAATNDTGVLRVTLTGSTITSTEFLPAYIDRRTGQPIPSTGAQATRILKEYAALHDCTGLAAAPS